MPTHKLRNFTITIAVLTLSASGCGIVEPPGTYDIPRAVTHPAEVSGDHTFSVISSGFFHSCALDLDGRAWCWGDNLYRQTGQSNPGVPCDNGIGRCTLRPAEVETDLRFSTISAGVTHSCALTSDGAAYCWGGGYVQERGILGDGQMTLSARPVAVIGGLRFKSISAGGRVTCGLSVDDRGYCWGLGGTVGDGTRNDALAPVPLAGNLRLQSISAGGLHACAVAADGVAWCWGSNQLGQIGDGRTTGLGMGTGSGPTVPVRVSTDRLFSSISAGGGYTCAVAREGDVLCWGENHVGQLGIGEAGQPQPTPRPVVRGNTLQAIASGTVHTCALSATGAAMCWGGNWFGALGDGGSTAQNTGSEQAVPTPARTSLLFSQIDPGGSHTCALTKSRRAWCWGDRARGQMGDGKA
ncbi:MAG TPA: hypothetical protein VHM24_00235 [Gemmatimonadaceae bacterium]|nr:hypothetical protein [Gemmatimonadaceae bacterium]